jgi:hypothetical protein
MVVEELNIEQGDTLGRFRWRSSRREADAKRERSEDQQRGKAPCEQSRPPAEAWSAAGVARDSRRRPRFKNLHRFNPFLRLLSHIAEASGAGLSGRPGHRNINAGLALSAIGRMDRIGGSPCVQG